MTVEIVRGLDTIRGLVGEPPREIPIDRETLSEQQVIMQDWNHSFIAIVLYCYKCKAPLTWHTPPEEEILFDCPNCGRRWVKGVDWPYSKAQKAANAKAMADAEAKA